MFFVKDAAVNAFPNNIPAMGMTVCALILTNDRRPRTNAIRWRSVSPTPPSMDIKLSTNCRLYVYLDRATASLDATAAMNITQALSFHGEEDVNANKGLMQTPMMLS